MAEDAGNDMGTTTAGIFAGVAAGDEAALGNLLVHFEHRMRVLVRARLASYPQVADLFETDDVRQGATARLIRAIRDVRPDTPARFWGLVGECLHRELLDLKRKWYGERGDGKRLYANRPGDPEGHAAVLASAPDPATGPLTGLAEDELHERVRGLPESERDVVKLHAYCGLSQREVADVLGLTRDAVRRLWYEAIERLRGTLTAFGQGAHPPG